MFTRILEVVESCRAIESFLAETTTVPGSVENLKHIYSAESRANQAYFLGLRHHLYPVKISISSEGQLIAGLPLEVIREYFQAAAHWGILERLSHLCYGGFALNSFIPPAPMLEGATIIGSATTWSDFKGNAFSRLNKLPADQMLEVWDPTVNKFTAVQVRPYRHASERTTPQHQGAIILAPTGFADRIAEKVDLHLEKVRDYFVREVLGGLERYL